MKHNELRMASDALGIVMRGRVRPTYFVPNDHLARAHKRFHRSIRLNDQFTLSWQLGRWKSLSDEFDWLKRRTVQAVVLGWGGLACSFDIEQTKNCGGGILPLESYIDACDSISQDVYEESEAVAALVQNVDARDTLMDGEIVGCVSRLYIPHNARGAMVWAEAIQVLTRELANGQMWGMLFVLQAAPLEMAWWNNERLTNKRDDDASEMKAYERRRKALIRLYKRAIGFDVLDETGWMGLKA